MQDRIIPLANERVVVDLADAGLPEVPLVGIHHTTAAQPGLVWHTHRGAMEICYLKKGERTYRVGGHDYLFRGNEVFVTFPDERHGSGDNPHGKGVLYWMQVRLSTKPRRFLNLAPADAMPLIRSLQTLPRRRFRGSALLGELFEKIYRVYGDRNQPFRKLALASRVLEFLIAIIEHSRADVARRSSLDIEHTIEFIRDKPDLPLDISVLATRAGLSVSRFKAKFREQTGMPPGEYVLRHKVELARSMLADGKKSVTDIAYDLGFSSSQYFSTVFKRFTQRRPSEVRSGMRRGRRA